MNNSKLDMPHPAARHVPCYRDTATRVQSPFLANRTSSEQANIPSHRFAAGCTSAAARTFESGERTAVTLLFRLIRRPKPINSSGIIRCFYGWAVRLSSAAYHLVLTIMQRRATLQMGLSSPSHLPDFR